MWAISMQTSIAAVIHRVKSIALLVKSTENYTSKNLRMVCVEVMSSQLPPSAACTEAGTCVITNSRSSVCINLGGNNKSPGSNSHLVIHPSLFHFFMMVWYVHKVEHIIRNYTRWWIEQRVEHGENIEQLCTEFALDTEFFSNLHLIFNHAVSHVQLSIEEYED
jgi:hypothetical protein